MMNLAPRIDRCAQCGDIKPLPVRTTEANFCSMKCWQRAQGISILPSVPYAPSPDPSARGLVTGISIMAAANVIAAAAIVYYIFFWPH